VIALLSGKSAIVAHGASVPFDYRELKDPAIRTILNSYDVMGGPSTFTMMSTTQKFISENPKVIAAVMKALKQAQAMIAADKREAAAVLLASMGGKGWTVDELVQILQDPTVIYSTRPDNVLAFASFMHEIGSIKNKPGSLTELFYDVSQLGGGT
jgi:NitT/TauT family transport system substrate-binding protein